MNDQTAAEFFTAIVAHWPAPPMTDLAGEVWMDTLIDLEPAAANVALRELMRTHTYRPTPAEFQALAGATPALERAFAQYMDAMSQPHPPAIDPAVRTVMGDLGGWAHCHAQPIEFHTRFRTAWRNRYGTSDPLTAPVPAITAAPVPELAEGPQQSVAESRAAARAAVRGRRSSTSQGAPK